jgi:hypothetical protein
MKLAIQFLTSLGLALAVTFGPCMLHGYNIFGCGRITAQDIAVLTAFMFAVLIIADRSSTSEE